MAPEHKFATAARLCSEVLSGFAEGTLPLDSAAEVLRDALSILASKDIKVHPGPNSLTGPVCPCQAASPSSPSHSYRKPSSQHKQGELP